MKDRKEDMEGVPRRFLDEEDPRLAVYQENIALKQEVAKLNKEKRSLIKQLHTDTVTTAFNRVGVIDGFTNTMVGEEGALYLIDLDKFKKLNDTFGHKAGDDALRMVADTMQSICREHDVVGRLGGDEFIIILDGVDEKEAAKKLKEFQSAFETMTVQAVPMRGDQIEQAVKISGTVGMETFKRGDTFDQVYRRADKKMYETKNSKGPSGR